jgi:hypothetical protein
MTERSRAPKLAIVAAAAAIAIGVLGRSRRRSQRRDTSRADTSFMRAMHGAFRRDLARLDDGETERWDNFRIQLDLHHRTEDDDLWPMLRGTIDDDLLDEMVAEHAAIPAALTDVDDAITHHQPHEAALTELHQLVLAHLEHEETAVLPLIEQRLTQGNGVSGCCSSDPSRTFRVARRLHRGHRTRHSATPTRLSTARAR